MDSSRYVLRVVMKTVVLTLKSRINEALILCDILRVPLSSNWVMQPAPK